MNKQRYRSILLILLTAGSMTIGAQIHFDLAEVPLSLQTFFLCLTALYFKPGEALIGQLVYLIAGFFAPVFVGNFYGMDVFSGPTAGYLYAFPAAAWVIARYGKGQDIFAIISWCVVAHFFILVCGYLWMILFSKMDPQEAFFVGFLSPLPGAFLKSAVAALLYWLGEKFLRKRS